MVRHRHGAAGGGRHRVGGLNVEDVMARADLIGRRWDAVADHHDVIRAIEPAVEENLDLLVPVDRAWQPTDYLPDLEADNWREQLERFRTTAHGDLR